MENRLYCSKVFRKLHLEVAARQDGLHVSGGAVFEVLDCLNDEQLDNLGHPATSSGMPTTSFWQ